MTTNSEEKPLLADLLRIDGTSIIPSHVFGYLGMGHYAFVGPVSKGVNRWYKECCDSVKAAPMVEAELGHKRQATSTDTFWRAAFFSVGCAEVWDNDNSPFKGPDRVRVCREIAKVGTVSVLQWAHETRGFRWDLNTCFVAAENGQLDCLKYAHAEGCPCNKYVASVAAKNGHLAVLKWLLANECPWDKDACLGAAQNGHLEVLKWLHSSSCPWDRFECAFAAGGGHLEVLQWLHENGCPWDVFTCRNAAQHGHLEALKYAREHGCPWDSDVFRSAACVGHMEILQYAHDNGCP